MKKIRALLQDQVTEQSSRKSEVTVGPSAAGFYEPITDDEDDSLFDDLWGDESSSTACEPVSSTKDDYYQDDTSTDNSSEVVVAEAHSKSGKKPTKRDNIQKMQFKMRIPRYA